MAVFRGALAADPELAVAVAAIKALTSVIALSKSETIMGLQLEARSAAVSRYHVSGEANHGNSCRVLPAPFAATRQRPSPYQPAASCLCGELISACERPSRR